MKKVALSVLIFSITFAAFCATADSTAMTNAPVVNNKYFTDSIRYNNLARLAFADGDFDTSVRYSAESVRSAHLSDDYVTQRIKIVAANKKIGEAASRLSWADKSKAQTYFPREFTQAKTFYNEALIARAANEWDYALNNAINVVEVLANIAAPPDSKQTVTKTTVALKTGVEVKAPSEKPGDKPDLPAQYTVRPWDTFGDCFWNIAARPWAYGDPYRWPILYRANKSKLADPNNPNLIENGMVLDIPSIRGEVRSGMWDSGKKYSPLDK
jgi:LysM repeat protein